MDEQDADRPVDEPTGDHIQREIHRLQTAGWRAPHGWKTKTAAWLIIIGFGLCTIAMIAIIIYELLTGASTM